MGPASWVTPLASLYQSSKPCPVPSPGEVGTGVLAVLYVHSRVATRPLYTLSRPGAPSSCTLVLPLAPAFTTPVLAHSLWGLLLFSFSSTSLYASAKGHTRTHAEVTILAHAQLAPPWSPN